VSWTLQIQHHTDENWVDWSGHQAYDSLERVIEVYTQNMADRRPWRDRWHWQIIDKDTNEIIPVEVLGL